MQNRTLKQIRLSLVLHTCRNLDCSCNLLRDCNLTKHCPVIQQKANEWQNHSSIESELAFYFTHVLLCKWGTPSLGALSLRVTSCFYTLACHPQDYGKFGVVDMDDKQKLFKLIKRLNNEPGRSVHGGSNDRGVPTPRVNGSVRGSGKDSSVDALEARLKAQMLDGNAALLSLADDPEDYLFQVCQAPCMSVSKCARQDILESPASCPAELRHIACIAELPFCMNVDVQAI